jgi:hypothetical protein
LLNEFYMHVMTEMHKWQGLSNLEITSADPDFVKEMVERVYPEIHATPTAEALPETRVFSRELVAYAAALLPVAPYFKAGDSRIAGISDNQYTTTLEMLTETNDKDFKSYLTRKTQGWFRRWGRDESAAAASASRAGAGARAAGAATPARAPAMQVSDDDEDGGGLESGQPETPGD